MKYYVFFNREKISGPHTTRKLAESDIKSRKDDNRHTFMFVVQATSDRESYGAADGYLENLRREEIFKRM